MSTNVVSGGSGPDRSYTFGKFYAAYEIAITLWSWVRLVQLVLGNPAMRSVLYQPTLVLFNILTIAMGVGLWLRKKWAVYLVVLLTLWEVIRIYTVLFPAGGGFGRRGPTSISMPQPWFYLFAFNLALDFIAIVYFWNRKEEFS